MQAEQTLASRLERLGKHQSGETSPGQKGWLDDLKTELDLRRQAEAEAQYRRDALMTRVMVELNRVHAVELLEEMNHELLESEGRVEPIYTTSHELCLSWPTARGRNEIYVAANVESDSPDQKLILVVRGAEEQTIEMDEEALKQALVNAFRRPLLNVHKWQ